MELDSSQLEMFAQICEFSTKMGIPASASDLSGSDVPEEAILAMRSSTHVVYITRNQLEAARLILCSIYEANRTFFDPESSYTNENRDMTLHYLTDQRWKVKDVTDAMAIGVMAARANMTVRIGGVDGPHLVLKPNNSHYAKRISVYHLQLMRNIFEVVCQQHNNFGVSEQPSKDGPKEN